MPLERFRANEMGLSSMSSVLARFHQAKRLQMSCSGFTRCGRTTGWPVACACLT